MNNLVGEGGSAAVAESGTVGSDAVVAAGASAVLLAGVNAGYGDRIALENVSLEIPRDKLIVVTGVSGSGKSSLAFDTIYAEGQRRLLTLPDAVRLPRPQRATNGAVMTYSPTELAEALGLPIPTDEQAAVICAPPGPLG